MRIYPYIYSQRDTTWASQQLGTTAGATIGQYGCLLTCHAMKAGYYGHQITPDALNDIYKNPQKFLYLSGDLISDADINSVFSDITFVEAHNFVGIPADLNLLKQLALDPNTTVTIEVDFDHDPADGIQTHFVELHDFDGVNLTIYDPWYGTADNFALHYGTDPATTIQKFAVYKGNATQPPVSVDSVTFQKLVTNSTSYDSVCDEVGEPHNTAGATVIADIAKIKTENATASQTISTLNQQLPNLKTENETLSGQITILQQQLAAAQQASVHIPSGIDYQTLYEQAQANLTKANQATENAVQTYNRAMGQYNNTSAYLLPPKQVIQIGLSRLFKLQK